MKKGSLKKFLSLGMAVSIGTAALTGCGDTSSGETEQAMAETRGMETEIAETDSKEQKEDKREVPTLVWWTVGNTAPDDFGEAVEQISDYVEEKIGVRLDIKISGYGEYDQKMNTIVNTGEYFDLMFVNNHNYNGFVNMNAFADLNELLPEISPELYEFIPEQLWEGATIKNHIYAVPAYKDSSSTQFWYMDDTYVQKYGIDMSSVKDMKTLDPYVRAIKEGEGDGCYPIQLNQGALWTDFFKTYDDLASGLQPLGVRIDDETRTVVSTLEQEDSIQKLNQLHEWYKDGIINPDANIVSESPKGKIFGNDQGWPSAVEIWQSTQGVEKYDAVQVGSSNYTTSSIQGSMIVISAQSKYKEEALKVLELMNTDSAFRDMCAYGTEGNYFSYNEDGTVKKLRDDWPWPSYTQGTFFILSIPEGTSPEQWDEIKAQNEAAVSSSCLGFTLDISPIQNEVANCNAAWDKYKYDLLTGAADPEEMLPKCMEDLRAAGLDMIISEAQKQLDEYFAE